MFPGIFSQPFKCGGSGAALPTIWMGKDSYPLGKEWRLMRHPVSGKSRGWLLNFFRRIFVGLVALKRRRLTTALLLLRVDCQIVDSLFQYHIRIHKNIHCFTIHHCYLIVVTPASILRLLCFRQDEILKQILQAGINGLGNNKLKVQDS